MQLLAHSRQRAVCAWLAACLFAACALLGIPAAFAADAVDVRDASGAAIQSSQAGAADADAVAVSSSLDAATLEGCSFGIDDFYRQNKGTNKKFEDAYFGYRYPMQSREGFSVVLCDGYAIAYVAPQALDVAGARIDDQQFQGQFLSLFSALDSAAAAGGQTFAKLQMPVYFTSADEVVVGDYTYRFGVEVEPGYYYATVTRAESEDGSAGGLYAASGTIGASDLVTITEAPRGLAALGAFFGKLDWNPLWVSLRTTLVALVFIFVLGLLTAWATMRVSDRFKGIFDTVFTIPMVLPPTVCGFLLLLLFGNSTHVGRWFIAHGIDIVFTWPAAVIACVVVGFPLMYRTVRGAFENLDPAMLDAARTLGWGEGRIFRTLMLPLAWPSIAAGTVLAFARAMGEFGCTLFFAGNYAGVTQTIPIAIYFDWMGGQTDVAIFWVIVVIVISFLVILFINIYSSHTQHYKRRLGD